MATSPSSRSIEAGEIDWEGEDGDAGEAEAGELGRVEAGNRQGEIAGGEQPGEVTAPPPALPSRARVPAFEILRRGYVVVDDDLAAKGAQEPLERARADRVVEDEDVFAVPRLLQASRFQGARAAGRDDPGVDLGGEAPAAEDVAQAEGHRALGVGLVEDFQELVDGVGHFSCRSMGEG